VTYPDFFLLPHVQIEEAEQVEAAAKKKAKEKQQREAGGLALPDADGTGVAGSSAGPATLGGYRSTASALHVYRQRQGVALDISGLPGAGSGRALHRVIQLILYMSCPCRMRGRRQLWRLVHTEIRSGL
jgi:hypothetical protein